MGAPVGAVVGTGAAVVGTGVGVSVGAGVGESVGAAVAGAHTVPVVSAVNGALEGGLKLRTACSSWPWPYTHVPYSLACIACGMHSLACTAWHA